MATQQVDTSDFGASIKVTAGPHTLRCLSAGIKSGEKDGKKWSRLGLRIKSKTEPMAEPFMDSQFMPSVEDVELAEAMRVEGKPLPGYTEEVAQATLGSVQRFGKLLKKWGVVKKADAEAIEAFVREPEQYLEKFKGQEVDARVYLVDQKDFSTGEVRIGDDGNPEKEARVGY